jgi:hypothetical protein
LAVAGPLLCAVASFASASVPPLQLGDHREVSSPSFEVEVRILDDTVRVVTDDRGGWRLERYFSGFEYLVDVEDSYGSLAQVSRTAEGRPAGVLLAKRYALEYFYTRPGGPCQRRILYEPRTGEVIAEVLDVLPRATQYEPESLARKENRRGRMVEAITVGGRSYAFVSAAPGAPVIRSLEIDDPSTGTVVDRIDYTESHLIVHFGSDVEGRPRVFTIPRHVQKSSEPKIVELNKPSAARPDTVWSLAGRGEFAAVPRPNLRGALPSAVEDALREAFQVALDRVREIPGCRSLFEEFARSGNQRLTTTMYSPPGEKSSNTACSRGALAYTHVGSSITHLCRGFAGLSTDQAAIVLIHEALHYAGMKEAPFYRGARTSKKINELVRDRCGF